MPATTSEPSSPIDLTPGNIRIPSKMCTPLHGRWADACCDDYADDFVVSRQSTTALLAPTLSMVKCGTLTLEEDDEDDAADVVAESAAAYAAHDEHLCHVRRYDPYSYAKYVEEYHCNCEDCCTTSLNEVTMGEFEYPLREEPWQQYPPEQRLPHAEYEQHEWTVDDTQYDNVVADTYDVVSDLPVAVVNDMRPGLMHFVPPPPPPRTATCHALVESGEGEISEELGSSMHYSIAMRWYNCVELCQFNWVSVSDLCPAPAHCSSFSDWCTAVTQWWLRHFEHAQKKWSMGMLPLKDKLEEAPGMRRSEGFIRHTDICPKGTYTAKPTMAVVSASLWGRDRPSDSSPTVVQ